MIHLEALPISQPQITKFKNKFNIYIYHIIIISYRLYDIVNIIIIIIVDDIPCYYNNNNNMVYHLLL